MNDSADISILVDLGLTQYAARAYLAMIGREAASPSDIARLTGIPRPRTYDVLASLRERGMIRQVDGETLRYRAFPPDSVLDRLLAVRRRELERSAERARELTDRLLPRFRAGQSRDEPLEYVEVLRDPRHAVTRIEELWSHAQREVLVFVRPPYLAPPPASEATIKAGITQRAIYEESLLANPELAELAGAYAQLGEEVRLIDRLPLKLTIVDGESVAFNMPDPAEGSPSVTTVVVHHKMLAETLRIAFDSLWSRARPLNDASKSQRRV
ncbi:Sugar-specific transcriptional regulator TrmB [Micromonospora viridifaciens]|uniref:Sugar-specific transcriptional regulator TrmB n=1 Tax=Micromonospora viridifaciens TaxID=1881 RepID=A0A1C4WWW1_MICVI|nr:helix-turn-helix domain-containing protein [Micromonospora viridifaciens]SCF00614.1 Sugar-specific transcriptional regulator TrmB [Micromonospora viridifaciens]